MRVSLQVGRWLRPEARSPSVRDTDSLTVNAWERRYSLCSTSHDVCMWRQVRNSLQEGKSPKRCRNPEMKRMCRAVLVQSETESESRDTRAMSYAHIYWCVQCWFSVFCCVTCVQCWFSCVQCEPKGMRMENGVAAAQPQRPAKKE